MWEVLSRPSWDPEVPWQSQLVTDDPEEARAEASLWAACGHNVDARCGGVSIHIEW